MRVSPGLVLVLSGIMMPVHAYPGGGWDGNNVKVSVERHRLLSDKKQTAAYPGGGWDANNVKVSVTGGSKLLKAGTSGK